MRAQNPSSYTAFGLKAEVEPLAPGLHVVATPIGNLKDISFRALSTLAAADLVLAEDTRVSRHLLAHYGISTPLQAYHEHNAAEMRPKIMERLRSGQALALISDAGTPLVSDPGFKLVESAVAEGFSVVPIPGPSAVLAALVAAGLPTDRFFFEGFLPPKATARRERLARLGSIPATLVFFESPRRLADMLADAASLFGDRPAAVATPACATVHSPHSAENESMQQLLRRFMREESGATMVEYGVMVALIAAVAVVAKRFSTYTAWYWWRTREAHRSV